jgi:SAM-dependent methyltransferase
MTRTRLLTEWDERYAGPDFAYGTEPNRFLVEVADRLPRGLALSLGEGEGRNAVFLAAAGWRVIGVDRSRVGLAKALGLATERGVPVMACVADLGAFPLPADRFDLVVSIFCHLTPVPRRALHEALVRALRPGGAFVLEAYSPRQLEFGTGGPKARELLVTVDALRSELAGLEFAVAREYVRDVAEGHMHRGQGAVVQVLGFRPGTTW